MINCFHILAALLLDSLLGDPHWIPHPVRWMGRFISGYEKFIRDRGYPLKLAGIFLALGLPAAVWSLTFLALSILAVFHETLRTAGEIWLIYQSVSIRGLIEETVKIYTALCDDAIEKAREFLSMVVGRDTQNLDETEIARATIETIAEGSVDGVFSPLFYAVIGGAPLALAFKAVNTLDSMIGYKNEKYCDFGWASAKMDDVSNWIPARISILVIPLAAWLTGSNGWNSLRVGFRDRLKHPSQNSAHAESAYAGALGIQLGGCSFYQGIRSNKPLLNAVGNKAKKEHVLQSYRLLVVSSVLFYFVMFSLNYFGCNWVLLIRPEFK